MNDKHRFVANWLIFWLLFTTVTSVTYLAYSKYAVDQLAVRAAELNATAIQNERIRREEYRETWRKLYETDIRVSLPRESIILPQRILDASAEKPMDNKPELPSVRDSK